MKRFGLVLFILFILYFIFFIRQDIINNIALRRDLLATKQKLNFEKRRASQLENLARDLNKSDYLEQLARTRLGLVKKGEKAYKVLGGEEIAR